MAESGYDVDRFKLTAPGGQTGLKFVKMDAYEALNESFEFRVSVMDNEPDAEPVSADTCIGTACGLKMALLDGGDRHFSGICTDFTWLGKEDHFNHYEYVMRPQLWIAGRKSNSRHWVDTSLQTIIEEVLDDSGVTNFEIVGSDFQITLGFVVQYQETNLAFLNRMFEKYGGVYAFEHTDGDHMLKIDTGDVPDVPCPGYTTIPYHPGGDARVSGEFIESVSGASRLRSSDIVVADYDPDDAATTLEEATTIAREHSLASNEVYVYPAGFSSASADGVHLADVLAQAEISEANRTHFDGTSAGLVPGCRFTITEVTAPLEGVEQVLIRAWHTIRTSDFKSGGGDDAPSYFGSFESQPSAVKFRVPKSTPWPRIIGPQSAIVVGDGEIDIDDEGRILVQFYWDRNAAPSCRIRVAQLWAGNLWGAVFVPRIGMEVIVSFMGGDPDRPLITGCVYNSENVNPVKIEKKTRSGFRSESSEGGNGYNFFGFDDLAGEEEIYIHAQKDMFREVINDDEILIHEGDRKVTVEQGDMTVAVDTGKIEITAETSIELKVGSNSIKLTQNDIVINGIVIEITASGNLTEKGSAVMVEGSSNTTIKGGTVAINP